MLTKARAGRDELAAIVRRLPGARGGSGAPACREPLEAGIHPYEIMIILDPEADEEQQQEILERVQQLIRDGGGAVEHLNDWGRRKIAYPIRKHGDGRYVVITSEGVPTALEEIERVLSISDVVPAGLLRAAEPHRGRAGARVGGPGPGQHPPRGRLPPAAGQGRRPPRPPAALSGSAPCPPT